MLSYSGAGRTMPNRTATIVLVPAVNGLALALVPVGPARGHWHRDLAVDAADVVSDAG